jgi:hypothetical protein
MITPRFSAGSAAAGSSSSPSLMCRPVGPSVLLLAALTRLRRRALVALMALAAGCSDGGLAPTPPENANEQPFAQKDFGLAWLQLPVPYASESPHIARGPDGFVVLSREIVGGKAITATHNYLYRSPDGITWTSVPLPDVPGFFTFRGITYAGGLYVIAGAWGSASEIWTSPDLSRWTKYHFDVGASGLADVTHAGGRLFALGTFRQSLTSPDGAHWTVLDLETLQPGAVVFGNGRYVLVGSGPLQLSTDGLHWQPNPLDCALPGACITDPGGGVHQGYHPGAVFAGDRFYVDQLWSSDGLNWQPHGEPNAVAYLGGYLLGWKPDTAGEPTLNAWKPGQVPIPVAVAQVSPPIPRLSDGVSPPTIQSPLPDARSCATHRCVIIASGLYLIP